MSSVKKDDFADDGRTIADMSGVTRRNPFGFVPRTDNQSHAYTSADVTSPDTGGLSRRERIWAILGALKAVLLIGLCFAAGLALVILMFIYL